MPKRVPFVRGSQSEMCNTNLLVRETMRALAKAKIQSVEIDTGYAVEMS